MFDYLDISVSILSSFLTGGFLLLLVENQHLHKSVVDRYYAIMRPFYHNLSKYFIFVSYFHYALRFKEPNCEGVQDFKNLLQRIYGIASNIINSGKDLPIPPASIHKIYNLYPNDVWYSMDCNSEVRNNIGLKTRSDLIIDPIRDALHELPEKYWTQAIDVSCLSKVSGVFYTSECQPVEGMPSQFENWQRKLKLSNWINFVCICLTVISLLIILISGASICVYIIYCITVFCAFFLVFCLYKAIELNNLSNNLFK